jgi:hypothetical protein
MKLFRSHWAMLVLSCLLKATHAATSTQPLANIVFIKIGDTVHNVEYANVKIPLNITETLEDMQRIKTSISNHIANEGLQHYKDSAAFFNWSLHQLKADRLIHRATALENILTKVPSPTIRKKRFIFTLVAIAVFAAIAAGTTYAIYVNSEVADLSHRQNTIASVSETALMANEYNSNTAIRLTKMSREALILSEHEDEKFQELNLILAALEAGEDKISLTEAALASAIHGKLAPRVLAEVNLNLTASRIHSYAAQNDLVPMHQFYSDWLQHECSFVKTAHGFELYIHIPLMGKGSAMTIYEHVSLPVPIDGDLTISVSSAKPYIAVSSDGLLFKALTLAELNQCRKYGDMYVCPRGSVVTRSPGSTTPVIELSHNADLCTYALFAKHTSWLHKLCDVHLDTVPDAVSMLSPTLFAAYTRLEQRVTIVCRGNKTHRPSKRMAVLPANQVTMLDIGSRCVALTDAHLFSSGDSAFTRDASQWSTHYNFTLNTTEMLKGLDVSQYKSILQKYDTFLATKSKIHVDDALRAIRRVKSEIQQKDTSLFATFIPGGGIGLVAFAALILSIYSVCRRPAAAAFHRESPSQLPMVIIPPPAAVNTPVYSMPVPAQNITNYYSEPPPRYSSLQATNNQGRLQEILAPEDRLVFT